jgi:neutral trehalase
VEKDRLNTILTPAAFMPLWCEMVPERLARRMVSRHLLDPRRLFGQYPFPSVAYNEPTYGHSWWRGPIWMPIAWAMTEVLRMYGFEKRHAQAVRSLVDMMAESDDLAELYDSWNGEPLGSPTLNWTCALFMDLARQVES